MQTNILQLCQLLFKNCEGDLVTCTKIVELLTEVEMIYSERSSEDKISLNYTKTLELKIEALSRTSKIKEATELNQKLVFSLQQVLPPQSQRL